MTPFPEIDLPLAAISGRSKFNPRQHSRGDIEGLAATIVAVGLLEPLLVVKEDGAYAALNGGNRLDALRLLQARAPEKPIVVRARLFEGGEIAAREAATAVSVTQTALHPVDKFEAFDALARSGMDVETIADHFHETKIEVRRCLKLADLSPIVRGLWREGKITREVAIAFTHGSREAQEALIEARAVPLTDAHLIARRLRADSLEPNSAEARYLAGAPGRVDRYIDNGGRVEEDLFAEAPIFLDAAIAHKTIDAILTETAAIIADREGWGWITLGEEDDAGPLPDQDMLEDEFARLDEIDAALKDAADAAARMALHHEAEEINARATLRAIPQKQRAQLGLRVEIDALGWVIVTRAIPREEPEPPREQPAREEREPPAPKGKTSAPPPLPPTEKIGKAEKSIRVEAINAALRTACAEDATLAAVFLVAALGCQWGREGIGVASEGTQFGQLKSELLRKIVQEKFATALLSCAQAAEGNLQAPITNAFSELIGRHIEVEDANPDIANVLLGIASRFDDIDARLAEAFDYPEYFRAVGKAGAVDAIREINGEAAAAAAEKSKVKPLVAAAANLAKDKCWLPRDLAHACGIEAKREPRQSTAEAMAKAIDADEAREEEAVEFIPPPPDEEQMRIFLCERCDQSDKSCKTPQPALVKAFRAFAAARHWPRLTAQKIARAMGDNGAERFLGMGDWFYPGVKLIDAPRAASKDESAPDEDASEEEAAPRDDVARVKIFLDEQCERLAGSCVKADELAALYDTFGAYRDFPPLDHKQFFAAVAANGVEKKGAKFLGLWLKDAAAKPTKGKNR